MASNEGIHKFSKDWVFLKQMICKQVNDELTNPDVSVLTYFYMMKLTDDILILKYKAVPKNIKQFDGSTDIIRHTSLFSVKDTIIISNLYKESNSSTPPWVYLGYIIDHKLYFLGESRTSGLCDAVYVRTVAGKLKLLKGNR